MPRRADIPASNVYLDQTRNGFPGALCSKKHIRSEHPDSAEFVDGESQAPAAVVNGLGSAESKTSLTDRSWFIDGILGLVNLSTICYVDVQLLSATVVGKANQQLLDLVSPIASLQDVANNYSEVLLSCIEILGSAGLVIPPWRTNYLDRAEHAVGSQFSVCHRFRTKGVGCWRHGDRQAGQIYRTTGGMTLRLLIDPRWVVPGHGHSELGSGNTTMAGIFLIEDVNRVTRTVVGRPMILGDPVYAWAAACWGSAGFEICRTKEHGDFGTDSCGQQSGHLIC